jgi:hypothetical protein
MSQDSPTPAEQEQEELEEQRTLVFDRTKAAKMQDALIVKTAGFNVERLVLLRSKIYQAIFTNRHNWDKGPLLEELQRILKSEKIL